MTRQTKGASLRNVAGRLYLNADAVADVRQLSGAGGQGTVDELGFQPLYDRIATVLFPWCSTLTTRARYFFFSLAVLDCGLRDVFHDQEMDEGIDTAAAAIRAEERRRHFERQVQRAERALSLALVRKYKGGSGEGIFGSIRCRQWAADGSWQVRNATRILSTAGRYPNAIYRGASRAVRMFASESSNSGLLTARVKNAALFATEWKDQAHRAMGWIRAFDEFWETQRRPGVTVRSALENLDELPAFKRFEGFRLEKEEATFLHERLCEATPYLLEIAPAALAVLVNKPTLDLLALRSSISNPRYKRLLFAAYHIDIATKEFRHIYQTYVDDKKSVGQVALDVDAIRDSVAWLDQQTEGEWCGPWPALSSVIRKWLSAHSHSNTRLVEHLCERAEEIVGSRGKVAPHKRPRNEKDLRPELEVQESSFRLGNGRRILKDVVEGLSS